MTFAEQIRFSFPRKIRYGCPHCGCLLVNALKLAGTRDICPDCARGHLVPGVDLVAEQRQRNQLTRNSRFKSRG